MGGLRTNLERVDHSMQELDDKERRHLALNDGHKVDAMPEHADEVVVRSGDHRRHVLGLAGALLRFEEVVAYGATHNALPVLLQEYVPRRVDEEETVYHCCCRLRQDTTASFSEPLQVIRCTILPLTGHD